VTLAFRAVAARSPTRRLRALLADRVLSAADTWERHLIVADLIGSPANLVDVGGLPGQLASFLPTTRVLAVNVGEPADLVVPADHLPFEDGAFEAATSLDVLEHIPPDERARFVHEVVRVARRRAVVCCPLGSPEHCAAEEEVSAWYRSIAGADHPWLSEHLANGLPTLEELQAAFDGCGARTRFLFHGDFREVDEQFRRLVLARHSRRASCVLDYARFRLPYRPRVALDEQPTPFSNRVFVVADVS
jgi:Methyltransferase domain